MCLLKIVCAILSLSASILAAFSFAVWICLLCAILSQLDASLAAFSFDVLISRR